MKRSAVVLFMFAFMIILAGFVIADQNCYDDNPPSMNLYEYYGKVYYGNSLVSDSSFSVIAMINGEQVGSGQIDSEGNYAVEVTKCSTITSGKIEFYVGDAYATNSNDWDKYQVPGGIISKPLDLELNKYPNASCGNSKIDGADECDDGNTNDGDGCSSICEVELHWTCKSAPSVCTILPYCGDGIVNNGETCSTCPEDVGACATTTTSSGSSGGSGGSGGSSGSVTYIPSSTTTSSDDNSNSESTNETNTPSTEQEVKSKSFFTGAVVGIGAFAGHYWWIILIVVLLVAGYFAVRKKLVSKNKKE